LIGNSPYRTTYLLPHVIAWFTRCARAPRGVE
jgi:hypothetical protein